MYNDILYHAVIPEDEEVFFDTHLPASKDKILIRRDSFGSCRSTTASSIGSSYMLSVGGESYDDDLSFMTELTETLSIDTSDNILSTEASNNTLSTEVSGISLSTETSEYIDQDRQTRKAYNPSKQATSKSSRLRIAKLSQNRNILGHGGCHIKDAYDLSDLDAALIAPSAQTHNPECSTTLDWSEGSKCSFEDYLFEDSGAED